MQLITVYAQIRCRSLKKRTIFRIGKQNFLVFYKEVTYIHIHYIIDTFSVVGSVPTPLNDLHFSDGIKGDFGQPAFLLFLGMELSGWCFA
jgi:hypothetical protein